MIRPTLTPAEAEQHRLQITHIVCGAVGQCTCGRWGALVLMSHQEMAERDVRREHRKHQRSIKKRRPA